MQPTSVFHWSEVTPILLGVNWAQAAWSLLWLCVTAILSSKVMCCYFLIYVQYIKLFTNKRPTELDLSFSSVVWYQAHSPHYLSVKILKKGGSLLDSTEEVLQFPSHDLMCLFFLIRVIKFILPLITAYSLCNYSVNTCIRIACMCGGGGARGWM